MKSAPASGYKEHHLCYGPTFGVEKSGPLVFHLTSEKYVDHRTV